MAKEKNNQNNQDNDGKGKSSCCAGCLGCGVVAIIAIVLCIIFVLIPIYKKYEDDINSYSFVDKLRNAAADQIDEWNYRYVRPAQEKAMELQQKASDSIENAKETVKESIDNPQIIIEKATDFADEPLLDD